MEVENGQSLYNRCMPMVCKGKKLYDKRQSAAERDAKRQIDRAMKERY